MSTGTGVVTLVVTVAAPVNNSPNVILSNVNINVAATMSGDVMDWQSMVTTIMRNGVWSGTQFFPSGWITLVTAIQTAPATIIGE